MLRLTEYIKKAIKGTAPRPFNGSIMIWNLTNVCNLSCQHCYASAQAVKDEEFSFQEIKEIIPQLKEAGIHFVILSGGEPLIRSDIYDIATALREANIKTYLSTNGLLVNQKNIKKIQSHFDYLGISIDGTPEIHDEFRGKIGAYYRSLDAIRMALKEDIKVGLRFTLTPATYDSLPHIFELVEKEGIPKVYFSHLVYSGRGEQLSDLDQKRYTRAVKLIINKAFDYVKQQVPIDIVTGNNETDAVILWKEFQKHYPGQASNLYRLLETWGGNQAGSRLINLDSKGNVKPDPFSGSVGNIKERSFLDIWKESSTLIRLREQPRKLKGICQDCTYLNICNGNSRARALAIHGDYWASDPACYLQDWVAG